MKKLEEGERPRYRWAILFVALYAFVAYAFAFQTVPPIISSIKAEFNILSDAEAALLMSIVLVPGIFLSLPAGLFLKKYGGRRVGFASLICVVLGCFVTATANSFIIVLAGRLILGLGGSFIVTTAPAIIAQWFTRNELGKAMGVYGICMPLATVAAFPSATIFMLAYGWRFPFYISLVVGIIAATLFVVVAKEGPFAEHENEAGARKALGNFEVWKVGLVWLFFNAATLSFTTWAPRLFETYKGMDGVYASFLASLLMWVTIFFVPLYGWMSDRTGRRKPFAIIGSFLMMLAFVALAYTSDLVLVVLIVALGVAAAMIPPIASALPAEILGPSLASVGFGITGMCMNLGAASAQPLVGFLLDVTKSYTYCFLGMAVLSVFGAIVAYTLKTN